MGKWGYPGSGNFTDTDSTYFYQFPTYNVADVLMSLNDHATSLG
jgi:hypothetical protein